ncbi:hypothetical protein C6558_37880 [Ensifer sp. NM-2]|uniref:glycosyltransferase n=1 Tax=Ensifer sp. NM-2 TaxID=2109730 RepID=UPI000D13B1D0|nr:glycosyltransferase [Ensifer sp. NM-2]PSS59505.1 hypothetical protein C6558_37880 [Ensifer sp. NM-2]
MIFSFNLTEIAQRDVFCAVDRESEATVGRSDDGLAFGGVADVRKWKGGNFLQVARLLATDFGAGAIVVARNPNVVIDENLFQRISDTLAVVTAVTDKWALISGAGLGNRNDRQCVYYSSAEPFLPFGRYIRPIVDSLPDFYILNASFLKLFLEAVETPDLEFIETGIILAGYFHGYVSVYAPTLSAAINGPFLSRELRRSPQLWSLIEKFGRTNEIKTFSGSALRLHGTESKTDYGKVDFADRYSAVIAPYLPGVSISIVTRTRFQRPHLLDRLLTSISRARPSDGAIEVILSTDIGTEAAEVEFARVRDKFPNISLRLCVNEIASHSRIDNLIGGFKSAKNDYIWIVDDDDYVDIFAFKNVEEALFLAAKPVIISGTQAHVETWEKTETPFPVLAESRAGTHWPPGGWRSMFGGVNQLPICSALIPRDVVLDVIDRFTFRYDLSEDYTLYLLLLCAPNLPEILELPEVLTHVSIREDGQNSVTIADRTNWTRDIAGFLSDLFAVATNGGGGNWGVVAAAATPQQLSASSQLDGMRAEVDILQRQVTSLKQQNRYLYQLIEETK